MVYGGGHYRTSRSSARSRPGNFKRDYGNSHNTHTHTIYYFEYKIILFYFGTFFLASDFAVGEAWGYKKFYEIKNLVCFFLDNDFIISGIIVWLSFDQETKGFLVKDTLLLKFGVRHPTFHQKCRDCIL